VVEPGGIEPVAHMRPKSLNLFILDGDFAGECTKPLYQTHRSAGGLGSVIGRDFLTQIPKGG